MRIVVLGGDASGRIVAASIRACAAAGAALELVGFLNDDVPVGAVIGDYRVLGGFSAWSGLPEDVGLIAAFPTAGRARERHARLLSLRVPDRRWVTVCDPAARVDRDAQVERGCYIGPHAVIEHGANIGPHAIVRAGAYVSHDVRLGAFAFVGPNATLLGRSRLGTAAHLAANAVCREGVVIGDYALAGIGSVVVADVPDGAVVAGNPARPLRVRTAAPA